MRLARLGVALVALTCFLAGTASAQTQADLSAALDHKQDAVNEFKLSLEAAATGISNGTLDNSTCDVYSSCSAELEDPFCHFNYGNSRGCGCDKGRTIDSKNSVVKTSPKLLASDYSVKRTACEAKHIRSNLADMYNSMIEKGDAKWLFYGSKDGVLINFPGIVWDENVNDNHCGADYDARIRPWHMTAATGPKNLILILDTSGSMASYDRISMLKRAAKAVLDATTFADFVGVVEFSSIATTYAGLTTLARAMPDFKTTLNGFIDGFYASGGTYMADGFERAFKLVDDSKVKNYEAGCHTTYVLVTDGEWSGTDQDPTTAITTRQSTHTDEHFFVVGLGDGVSKSALRSLSCKTGAIYTQVVDNDESGLKRAMISFYKYYALFKSLNKVEGYSWSEPYASIPSIWGPMTTVVAPVYDKSREPWHMMGVAGVDATVCDLLTNKVPAPTGSTKTQRGCSCRETWTYNGNSYAGCTTADWPVPWCATTATCGSCATDSVEGGCWDDCEPEGKEGVLQEALLSRATAWCEPASLDACALEALRLSVGEQKCGTSETNFAYASCSDAKIANYSWAIDGPTDPASTSFTLKSTKSTLLGTAYDMNADECKCDDTMQPTCACAAIAAMEEDAEKRKKKDDGGDTTIVFYILLPLLLLISCCCYSCQKCSGTRCCFGTLDQRQGQGGVQMYMQPTIMVDPQGNPYPYQPGMPPQASAYPPSPQASAYPQPIRRGDRGTMGTSPVAAMAQQHQVLQQTVQQTMYPAATPGAVPAQVPASPSPAPTTMATAPAANVMSPPKQVQNKKFCGKCGVPQKAGNKFCGGCGASVS